MTGRFVASILLFAAGFPGLQAHASNLTISTGGIVSIELLTSDAAFRNTLSISSPTVSVAFTGCKLEPSTGLPGTRILSEKISQRGCRVTLDADPATPGVQGFAAGTTLQFRMCAQTDADAECEHVWASDPAANVDAFDHVRTVALHAADYPDRIFRLEWEDLPGGGDLDFNDLVAVVRADMDTDGDGLWDDWERFGADTTGDGVADLDLPGLGADPRRKDVFLEIDWMDCATPGGDCAPGDTHSHQPDPAAVIAVIDAFANANVANPDGSNGITLHLDVSNALVHQEFLDFGAAFDAVKADPANFGPANPRRFAYHYALFTHDQSAALQGTSGVGELPGNDFIVSLGSWTGGVGTIMQQAGTLIHEFGHNLGLGHGGGDGVNYKPNYLSTMSYRYQTSGIPPTDPDGAGPLTARIDYSRVALADLDEFVLTEPAGVGDGTDTIFWRCPDYSLRSGPGNAAVDWNCNGTATEAAVDGDVNGDRVCVGPGADGALDTVAADDDLVAGSVIWDGPDRTCDSAAADDDRQLRAVGNVQANPLTGYWDWDRIRYDFQTAYNFEDGFRVPLEEPELDRQMFLTEIAADLGLALAATPGSVRSGATVSYTLTVRNKRPGAAHNVLLTDTLPPALRFVSCAATGGGVCDGSGNDRSVRFPVIGGGGEAAATLVAEVLCDVPDGTVIVNDASVAFSEPDPDPDTGDNTATVSITAVNPAPTIAKAAVSPGTLWPPNHKMTDVLVRYEVTDNCGVPRCALAVHSNEPQDGLGDGDSSPDWEVLSDRRLRLRAERSGTGSGRVYTTTLTCTDSSGAATSQELRVTVPRNQRR